MVSGDLLKASGWPDLRCKRTITLFRTCLSGRIADICSHNNCNGDSLGWSWLPRPLSHTDS